MKNIGIGRMHAIEEESQSRDEEVINTAVTNSTQNVEPPNLDVEPPTSKVEAPVPEIYLPAPEVNHPIPDVESIPRDAVPEF